MNKYQKLWKNISFFTIANFASKLLTFLLVPLYTAVLTTEQYGTADIITITVSLVFPIFTLCINEGMMRFAIDKEHDKSTVLSFGLLITFFGGGILLIFYPFSKLFVNLSVYYLYFFFYYISFSLYNVISYFAKGMNQVKKSAYCGVVNTVLVIVLNIVFISIFEWGLIGYLLSYCIAFSLSSIVLFKWGRFSRYLVIPSKFNKKLCKEMLKYSVPMIPNSIGWWISNSSDKYMLTFFVGLSTTGVYSIAYKIPTIFSVFSNLFMGAWRLSAAEEYSKENAEIFYNKVFQTYLSCSVIITSVLVLFTRIIAKILFAKDFFNAYVYVPILIVAALLHGVGEFYGVVYTSVKKTNKLLFSSILGAVSNIVFNFLLIPNIGGMGAAIATLLSYFLIVVVRIADTKQYIKLEIMKLNNFLSIILLNIEALIIISDINHKFSMLMTAFIIILFANRNVIVTFYKFVIINIKKVR